MTFEISDKCNKCGCRCYHNAAANSVF